MFTWIIETKNKILDINDGNFVLSNIWDDLKIGDSIAHDGACMSVVSVDKDKYSFFAMQETLSKTNFNAKQVWDTMNVERSLRYNDRIDWHFVTWHIDCIWTVQDIQLQKDKSILLFINYSLKFAKYIVKKWSIAVNWVSLTVIDIQNDLFSASLIPLTLQITNLWELQKWDKVNLEFDILGKYVERNLIINQNNNV